MTDNYFWRKCIFFVRVTKKSAFHAKLRVCGDSIFFYLLVGRCQLTTYKDSCERVSN